MAVRQRGDSDDLFRRVQRNLTNPPGQFPDGKVRKSSGEIQLEYENGEIVVIEFTPTDFGMSFSHSFVGPESERMIQVRAGVVTGLGLYSPAPVKKSLRESRAVRLAIELLLAFLAFRFLNWLF